MTDSANNSEPAPRPPTIGSLQRWFKIGDPVPKWQAVLLGGLCIALCGALWWGLTRGDGEERVLSPVLLPSPEETFASFPSLWTERALTRNILITLRRVTLGFALATLIGVPLGVLAGCFTRLQAFLAPLVIFGRNIPIAALIPITFFLFGIGEIQKMMFIFIASVAFILADTINSVANVGREYIDTAYTLGANRWQVIIKVLVPLALPNVFNSLRLLFGLAFGYIMLAELIKFGDEAGGLGYLINTSQHRGPREHIYLIVLIIPVIALLIDRGLFWVQRELFPYRYGGIGILNQCVRGCLHVWDDFKGLFSRPAIAGTGVPPIHAAPPNEKKP